ncbi:MAG: class I SAM-dependent methyltransferase [Candidatus Zixiibacteriota bacterium]|nr:MAG: class I SAM-dependent methyltransferase [candidate division Zixibacteria bacterium]
MTNETDHHGTTMQTINTYDRIAARYCEKTRLEKYLRWEREYVRKLIAIIGSTGPLILDVGCGDGRHCRIIDEEGGKAIGIDLSQGMLREAKLNYPEGDFCLMDMRSLSFQDSFFDGIWSSGSIYHVTKAQARSVLSQFHRVLKPGGVLGISFKLGEGEGLESNPKSYAGSPRYFAYYSALEMSDLLAATGFTQVETCLYPEEVFGADNLQMWLRK